VYFAADKIALISGSFTNSGYVTSLGNLRIDGAVSNAAGAEMTLEEGGSNLFASLTNAGTITAAPGLTVTGAYTQNAGSLTTGGALSTGSLSGTGGEINIGDNTFLINQTANGNYAGSISGSGDVVKTGAATLTLSGAAGSFAPAYLDIVQGTVAVNGAAAACRDVLAVISSEPTTLR